MPNYLYCRSRSYQMAEAYWTNTSGARPTGIQHGASTAALRRQGRAEANHIRTICKEPYSAHCKGLWLSLTMYSCSSSCYWTSTYGELEAWYIYTIYLQGTKMSITMLQDRTKYVHVTQVNSQLKTRGPKYLCE